MPKFTLLGQEYIIEEKDIESKAHNLKPAEITNLTHIVEIDGKKFPILQLIAETVGIPKSRLIPLDAYKILDKLGYSIEFYRSVRSS